MTSFAASITLRVLAPAVLVIAAAGSVQASCFSMYLECLRDPANDIDLCKLEYRNWRLSHLNGKVTGFDADRTAASFTSGETITLSAGNETPAGFLSGTAGTTSMQFFVAPRAALDPDLGWTANNWTFIGMGTFDPAVSRWELAWNTAGYDPSQQLTIRARAMGSGYQFDDELPFGTSEDLAVLVPSPGALAIAGPALAMILRRRRRNPAV